MTMTIQTKPRMRSMLSRIATSREMKSPKTMLTPGIGGAEGSTKT
jgi:hypothetical protein